MRTKLFKTAWIVAAMTGLLTCQVVRADVDSASLEKALTELATFEYGKPFTGFDVIRSAINEAASKPETRAQLEQKFIGILKPGSTRGAKDIACRSLGLVGSESCVPAVADLLTDPDLSHMARYCLEELGIPSADAALRKALSKTDGALKIGIITSLGALQDKLAVSELTAIMKDSDRQIAAAAISALGRIATPDAGKALLDCAQNGPSDFRETAAQACVSAANKLRQQSNIDTATAIFQALYSNQFNLAHPERFQPAGLAGLIRTQPHSEIRYLLPALAGTNSLFRQTAADLATEPTVSIEPLLASLPALPAPGQIALLGALVPRVEPGIMPAILPMFDSASAEVRAAALSVLIPRANTQDIPRLAKLAATQPDPIQQMAHQALVSLPGAAVNAAILQHLAQAEPIVFGELARCLVARSATDAAPVIVNHLSDPHAEVRLAALEALTTLGNESQLSAMIAALQKAATDDERASAASAIRSVCERSREKGLEPVTGGLAQSDTALKPLFLGFLARIGGARALDPVREAIKSPDTKLHEAAVRALAEWPDIEAEPELQALIQSADRDLFRKLAFRGYVRLAKESDLSEPEKVKLLAYASEAARNVDEKRLTLGALAELNSPEALQLARHFVPDADAASEACVAAVSIISRFDASRKELAAPVLRQVIQSATDPTLQQSARKQLARLGITE